MSFAGAFIASAVDGVSELAIKAISKVTGEVTSDGDFASDTMGDSVFGSFGLS